MKVFAWAIGMALALSVQAQEKASNREFWHSATTTASPEAIWRIWTDVSSWKNWDSGLKEAQIEGSFVAGAKGRITTLEGRKVKFKVVEFEEGSSYTYRTALPLGGLYVKRYLEVRDGKTCFTHRVWFQGLTAGIFARQLGGDFREMLPEVLENIKKIAEK